MVARLAHTQEVNGSNPFPATSPPELPERDPARDSVVGVKSALMSATFRSFFVFSASVKRARVARLLLFIGL